MTGLARVKALERATRCNCDAYGLLPGDGLVCRKAGVQLNGGGTSERLGDEQFTHVFGTAVTDGRQLTVEPFYQGIKSAETSQKLVAVWHICIQAQHRSATASGVSA